jgi:hypothetical protein
VARLAYGLSQCTRAHTPGGQPVDEQPQTRAERALEAHVLSPHAPASFHLLTAARSPSLLSCWCPPVRTDTNANHRSKDKSGPSAKDLLKKYG